MKRELQKVWCMKSFSNLPFKGNFGGLFRGLFCSGFVWGGWNYFCFHLLKDKQLLLMKMLVLQTMCPKSGFQIAPNWPKIWKMTILNNNFTIWHHRQFFFWSCCVFLVMISYWFQFQLITDLSSFGYSYLSKFS